MNLTIETSVSGDTATMVLEGKLDLTTERFFDRRFQEDIGESTEVVLDFAKVSYLSSAGLRSLLKAQKHMAKRSGSIRLCHPTEAVLQVLKTSNFGVIIKIEP